MRVACVAMLLALSQPARAQTRPLDMLPGEEWMRASRPGFRAASARPLAGMSPDEHWIDLRSRFPGHVSGRLRLRALRAGPLALREVESAAHWRSPWVEFDLAAKITRLEIHTLGAEVLRSGAAAWIVAHGPWRLGARAAFAPRPAEDLLLWELALHFRLQQATLAVHRRVSHYASRGIWSAAAAMQLHPRFQLGLWNRDAEVLLQLCARASRVSLRLSQPLASPHGGGMAIGVEWSP